jgi:hypothetical protein
LIDGSRFVDVFITPLFLRLLLLLLDFTLVAAAVFFEVDLLFLGLLWLLIDVPDVIVQVLALGLVL